ncbi:hypothetical protein TIFTF001_055199 [Ficus carica]|uniref:Uncharacterized protein n=1 Tax=Ficus carica TaxID=3494 RepID=A0AA88JH90_FICCA|nr:hypothetical protein TIFTF001_055199 [Ficus carica]
MADQMRMDFQRERNEMVTTLWRQLRDELLEEQPPPPPPAPAI